MVIVDNALKLRENDNNPIKISVFGAGYIGRGLVLQIEKYIAGMTVSILYNRTISKAFDAFNAAGITDATYASSLQEANALISAGKHVVTDDPSIACQADAIEAILEVTGDVEFSAKVTLDAINHGKHIVLQNAELDATVGPILKYRAERAGLVFTNGDGDQPGTTMNLFRWVKTIGIQPLLAGNLKGILDPYRTPQTQAGFAAANGLTPQMATNLADGTKLSFEMALIGNATGFGPLVRGMHGPRAKYVEEAKELFDAEELIANGGSIDYLLGAEPGPGVFVLGVEKDSCRAEYLRYFKMGKGPLYCFYIPYHLTHLESPLSVARAVLFKDATVTPLDGPVVDVITIAKRDLATGEELDGIGGFTSYGVVEKYSISRQENLLPMGISAGCKLIRPVAKDQPIKYSDINRPNMTLSAQLRAEQDSIFSK